MTDQAATDSEPDPDSDPAGAERLDPTSDELAGVVDLFGALTREELADALAELAFKRDVDPPEAGLVEAAVDEYALVEFDRDDETLLVPGPTAFPTLPARADDLPHILDVEVRSVDRERLGHVVDERLRREAARATAEDDRERMAHLLDVSYDLEAWAPVAVDDVRDRLDDARSP